MSSHTQTQGMSVAAQLPVTQPAQLAAMGTNIADPKAVIAQVAAIQQIMKAVMKEGTHFGVIPGTNQPSLYKPGSEVLLSAFKIAVEPEVREIRDGNHITYQVQCVGRHIASGLAIGAGIGEASTAEDKYAWRAAVCDEEFDATPEDRRRVKWNKGKYDRQNGSTGAAWCVNQVRTNPADIANTVLKMAKKRAQIDLCLTALAASDIFTQDIEDLPPEYIDGDSPPPPRQTKNNRYQERPKTGQPTGQGPAGAVSEAQVTLLHARLNTAGKSAADLITHLAVESVESLPKGRMNEALDWIAGKGGSANA